MRNADEDQEHDETPLTPRCGYCRDPLLCQRDGAIFCSRRCKELAREKRKRDRARVDMLREKYPLADQSLMELYQQAGPPRRIAHEDQDDEAGHYTDDDQADDGPDAWNDELALTEALRRIEQDAERRAEPYLQQLRRNPGRYFPELATIQNEYNTEHRRLIAEHERQRAMRRAERDAPLRQARAEEEQRGRQAIQAFAGDLGRGGRYTPPSYEGRATSDIWRW